MRIMAEGMFDAWRQWAEEADNLKSSQNATSSPRIERRTGSKVHTARQERYTDAGYRRTRRAQAKGCGSGSDWDRIAAE